MVTINHTSDRFSKTGFHHLPDSPSAPIVINRDSSQKAKNEEQRKLLIRLASGAFSNPGCPILGWEQSTIEKFGKIAGEIEKPEDYSEPDQCLKFLQTKANDDMLEIINQGLDTCLKLKIPATHYVWGLMVIASNQRLTGKHEFSKASDSLLKALQEYPLDQYPLIGLGYYVREALECGLSKEEVSLYVKNRMQSQKRDIEV